MKKYTIALMAQLAVMSALAQNVKLVLTDTLRLPTTTELTATTQSAALYNPGPFVIEVADIDIFEIYGNMPIATADTAFVLQPGDTQQVDFTFLPEHNIQHALAAVVKTKSGFGHAVVPLSAQGTYSISYYATTQNKSEAALKAALSNKLGQGYNSLGYSPARDQMFMSIDNKKINGQMATVNTLECVYTGTTITGYANRQAAQNGNPQFNTEHTFPQGKFNSNEPMRSDLHHLFPTTNSSNSKRGNDPFGMVNNPTWTVGGSKSGGGTFEPRNAQKGFSARAMMYFVMRYQDYGNFFQPQETVLRNWHRQYPPTPAEVKRNADIFALQNNRNPFIDYPQLAERIPSLVSNSGPAPVSQLYTSDDTIKLAMANGRYIYQYVLYNSGNQDINLSNFALSDTSLHFVNSMASTTLAPHQFLAVPISFDANANYTATLSYRTNVAGQVSQSVPIVSGPQPQIGLGEQGGHELAIHLYPNPAEGYVTIEGKNLHKQVTLVSAAGTYYIRQVSNGKLNVENIPAGLYLLKVQNAGGYFATAKLIIR